MTQHSHSTYVDGCFRCDLSRDEVTADHLRLPPPGWHLIPDPSNAIVACDDCEYQLSQHSSEGGVGCLHVTIVRAGSMQTLVQSLSCPCLRPGTSQADQ